MHSSLQCCYTILKLEVLNFESHIHNTVGWNLLVKKRGRAPLAILRKRVHLGEEWTEHSSAEWGGYRGSETDSTWSEAEGSAVHCFFAQSDVNGIYSCPLLFYYIRPLTLHFVLAPFKSMAWWKWWAWTVMLGPLRFNPCLCSVILSFRDISFPHAM